MFYPARSEQNPEKSTVSTVPFFVGHPVYILLKLINSFTL